MKLINDKGDGIDYTNRYLACSSFTQRIHRSPTLNTLAITTNAGVRVIEMNRPDSLNALNPQMMDELAEIFLNTAIDDEVKVVVLTGAGRAFSAGADLAAAGDYTPTHGLAGMIDAMIEFPKPFIAAVNGLGVGYGATVCGLADVVIMSDKGRLRAPFSALGLTAELSSTYTFPRLMGRQHASWFLLAAEWLDANACLEAGLALEVVPADQLMVRVHEQADKLAKLPLASLVATKRLIMEPLREQMKASVVAENAGLAELRGGPANKEAVAAFLQKREADFSAI
jgi:enoyl-CoA hydratase/carnithine racemase